MEGTAVRGRLSWQAATVDSVTRETAAVVTIEVDPPAWPGHRAGQHLDVRLTADDGYTAEREYSIASAPGEPVAITVERLDDGEVSPYLTGELRAGDELGLRGPVGAGLHLRAHQLRRDRRGRAGGPRLPARAGADRVVRGDRRALMDPVDGNAIGGSLIDVFGTEMTAASSTCAVCGARRPVAELVVYRRAPGTVVRCRTCGSVLMVLVRRTNVTSVDLSGLADLGQPGSAFIPAGGIQDGPAR
jgi:Family of unknown function (DUF6510)/Oxidoreductase FAD-binding domain